MAKRFWVYLICGIIAMAFFAAMSVFLLFPALLRYLPEQPSYAPYIFAATLSGVMLLIKAIERKIQKIDSDDKTMLKRYKVIDLVTVGFIGVFFICWLIHAIRSWIP